MADKKQQRPRRRQQGYVQKSNAICVVVHDQGGNVLPDAVAAQILNSIDRVVREHGLIINFTRT